MGVANVSQATQEFLARKHKLFIGGEWVDTIDGEEIPVINPATEEQITTIQGAGPKDIDAAVAAARKAFKGEWSLVSAHDRTNLMLKLADAIDANLQLFSELETLDNGQPLMVAQYTVSQFGSRFIRYYAGWCTKITGETIPASPEGVQNGSSLTYTRREPIGVVGAITPWNAPIAMAILKLAPALATGCTLVLKCAELTPLTALLLGDMCKQVGIPDGVVNIVPGYGQTAGQTLVDHPDVDKISFTGSTAVGKKIIQSAASTLKKVTLELGGKSPVVVFPDADLERVIPAAMRAAFFLQGQNCMAGTRLFVHDDIYDTVVNGVAEASKSMKLGNGLDPETLLGPLISEQQRGRVMEYVEWGKNSDAELVVGGNIPDGPGYFVEPTLFGKTNMDMKIAAEEIFGPVLCAQSFGDSDLEAVAAEANKTIYGLSGSVFTRDISTAHRMASMIDSGQVSINCHAAVDPAVPFGGNKQSGWGREFGREGLDPYLKTKATTVMY